MSKAPLPASEHSNLTLARPVLVVALALSALAAVVLLPALATAVMRPATAAIEGELDRLSDAADRLAAFERNVQKVALEQAPERPIPFGGFLARIGDVGPGRHIDLLRDEFGPVRAVVLAVERVAQSVSLAAPSVARMDLVLVRARLVDPLATGGDHVVTPDGPAAADTIVNLLFAVRPADAKPAADLAAPATHQSL